MAATAQSQAQRELEIAKKQLYDWYEDYDEMITRVEATQDVKDEFVVMVRMWLALEHRPPWLDQVSACAVALDPSTRDIQDFWGISGLEEIKMRMMEVGERMNQAFINRRKDSNGTSCPQ